jgi:NADPH:quinone reductase-like Zn-dependent oxidoreductase
MTMRAATRDRFGTPDVISLTTVERPEVPNDGVLVRVKAASLNRADWYELVGKPMVARPSMGFRAPKTRLLGNDFAGVVEAVGSEFTGLAPGDEVFGGKTGALAEFVTVKEAVVRKPPGISFEEAAALPIAGLTALQALRDHGGLESGEHVIINGASGGVGTFAIQIAKAMGAEVTAVCSASHVDLAGSLGADRVIDSSKDDFTESGLHCTLFIDIAGGRGWGDLKRVLDSQARLVIVGGPTGSGFLGPLFSILKVWIAAKPGDRSANFFIAKFNRPDLETLGEMAASGAVRPVIDSTYPLDEVVAAFEHQGYGHPKGKIVVTV